MAPRPAIAVGPMLAAIDFPGLPVLTQLLDANGRQVALAIDGRVIPGLRATGVDISRNHDCVVTLELPVGAFRSERHAITEQLAAGGG